MQHILTAEQFTNEQLLRLFKHADEFRGLDKLIANRRETAALHTGRVMLSMFYEPSTRTRFSFEIAAAKLGIAVIGTENAAEFSSAAKGETIEDTVRVFNEYGVDAIVMRTKEEGHAARAAAVSEPAILNGGDGKGEHPTQAVLDAYTIYEKFGRLDNLNIVFGGDLAHGRTARSLVLLLCKYPNNSFAFVSAPELSMGDDITERLTANKVRWNKTAHLESALKTADVVYWTRMQLERHKDSSLKIDENQFVLNKKTIKSLSKEAIILHPLPRNHEIAVELDTDPRAQYFHQAGGGLYARMAMLDEIMQNRP
jgi:aspartate carbamoyltransferase catalytic subunit